MGDNGERGAMEMRRNERIWRDDRRRRIRKIMRGKEKKQDTKKESMIRRRKWDRKEEKGTNARKNEIKTGLRKWETKL